MALKRSLKQPQDNEPGFHLENCPRGGGGGMVVKVVTMFHKHIWEVGVRLNVCAGFHTWILSLGGGGTPKFGVGVEGYST